jgi:protein ImuB
MALVCGLVRDRGVPLVAGALEAIARACSPRIEQHGDDVVIFDASGLERVLGSPTEIAGAIVRLATDRKCGVRVALAGSSTSAWLLAHAQLGVTVVESGGDADALAPLSLEWLTTLGGGTNPGLAPKIEGKGPRRVARARHYRMAPGPVTAAEPWAGPSIAVLRSWGLHTLGDLARLPRAEIRSRLGSLGVRMHEAACGEDAAPLVPAAEAQLFVEHVQLEWPIEGLEPLSFVLSRACESLSVMLEHADRGAVGVTTILRLVNRTAHVRTLRLPAPMRDARVLRTLILLDLESHPPGAGIDVVDLELEVAPGRIVTGALFAPPVPVPEDLATLVARLGALMGESRVGAPVAPDTHNERSVDMKPFSIGTKHWALGHSPLMPNAQCLMPTSKSRVPSAECRMPASAFHRFRFPVALSVVTEDGRPVMVRSAGRVLDGGRVRASAGPWRSSGAWWSLDRRGWDRDDWDVELPDGLYRISCDRSTGHWNLEGWHD